MVRIQSCLPIPNKFGDQFGSFTDPYADPSADDATPLHFTGKEHDTESDNDYFEARYYANSMGRFMSPDWSAKVEPIPYAKLDNPQSLNLYAYVGNNPLTDVDVDGHMSNANFSALFMEGLEAQSAAWQDEQAEQASQEAQQEQKQAQSQNAGASPSSGGTSRTVTLNIGGKKVTVAYSYGKIFSNYGGGVDITATAQNCSGCWWGQVVSRTGAGAISPKKDGGGIGPLYGDEGGGANVLYDTPASSGAGTFRATAVLGVTDISGKSFAAIGGFTYGYSINANGGVTMMAPSVATPHQMNGAIQVLQNNSPDWTIH